MTRIPDASPEVKRRRRAGWRPAGATLAGVAAFGLCTADTRTQLLVQATVLPLARVTSESAPDMLEITAIDSARGYVDVSQPTRLSVQSNGAGFVLDVHTIVPVLAGISVYGLDANVSLAGEGGSIVARHQAAGRSDLDLTYHLLLTPGTAPGRYVWPLQIAVRPLLTP